MPPHKRYAARLEAVRQLIARLFDDFDATVAAVVADGWTEPMVRAGFDRHRRTWAADALAGALKAELAAIGGVDALGGWARREAGRRVYVSRPDDVVHIWPTLPGAGLTPVLFGALLGVSQHIRPAGGGQHFAERVVGCWNDLADSSGGLYSPLELLDSPDGWTAAQVVVVSGTDDTIAEVRRRASGTVSGYGHRVSLAVVVDGEEVDLQTAAERLAEDAVLWHQTGCFSPRGVIFCGAPARRDAFGQWLGQAIARHEDRLRADDLSAGQLARQRQVRGVAEFTTRLWGSGLGWAQLVDGPFDGDHLAAHTLSVHAIETLEQLDEAIAVGPDHLQGVALQAPLPVRSRWAGQLAAIGATRICRPGSLQAPPAGWFHDGRPNVIDWLRTTTAG